MLTYAGGRCCQSRQFADRATKELLEEEDKDAAAAAAASQKKRQAKKAGKGRVPPWRRHAAERTRILGLLPFRSPLLPLLLPPPHLNLVLERRRYHYRCNIHSLLLLLRKNLCLCPLRILLLLGVFLLMMMAFQMSRQPRGRARRRKKRREIKVRAFLRRHRGLDADRYLSVAAEVCTVVYQ
jgi:hypothetical protein